MPSPEILARRERCIPRGVAVSHPVVAAHADGARLTDVDGITFLDFASGISVLNVGHRHPRVVAAVHTQLDALMHSAFQVAIYEPYVDLAERLSGLLASDGGTKTLLLSTGVEATENAIKIARAYTNRPGVVAFTGGFHGRTLLGMTLTASGHGYRQNFGPFAPDIHHAPFPSEYHGWTTARALEALDELFATEVPANRVAAIIIEPVLGEGGFVPAPAEFLRELRRRATKEGIVLELQERFAAIGDVRGPGAMLAIELVRDRDAKTPDAALTQRVIEEARLRGLLLLKCGPHKNVIRLPPPLIITDEDVDTALAIMGDALAAAVT